MSLKSTYFQFRGKYYHYTAGEEDEDERGLTIGGCASAFLWSLIS